MTYPGFATVQVRTELCLDELTALYWDGLVERVLSKAFAERHVMDALGSFTGATIVQSLVRQRLSAYGERSVHGGRPMTPYPASEEFRVRLKAIVARAYKIVY